MNTLLTEILAARERRAQKQQQLLGQYGLPLICFTMNIPGPTKDTPLIRRAFRDGLARLDGQLNNVVYRDVVYADTGCEAFFVADMAASQVKTICTAIEESCSLGRLFDMDVLDISGRKLERETQRGCMVCGKPGRACAASRAHSAEILWETTQRILTAHFAIADSAAIASFAHQALLDEVHTTPKPGLVDENNCGSHADMDIRLFTASANALTPYFLTCAQIGQQTAEKPPEEAFPLLRQAGLAAEKQMFAVTGGVNTHKGAIYTLGILCGAAGRLWRADTPFAPAERILQEAGSMTAPSAKADFAGVNSPKTAGETLYLQYGLTGIRGEAAAGFPSIANISLPVYRQQLETGKMPNDAAATVLVHLIAHVDDTNLYHRGGKEGAEFAKAAAAALLPSPTKDELLELDKPFIKKNLSPGGCADLLAATLFLEKLEKATQQFKE